MSEVNTEFLDAMVQEVARLHGVTFEQLMGKRRTYKIAHARQEAYYRVRVSTRWSFPDIGKYFGKHHASIINGINRHLARVSDDTGS